MFSNHFNKTALFFTKFQLVIIWAVYFFESLQQNCFIFQKISTRDNRSSSNFAITATKLPSFREIVFLAIIEAVQFSPHFTKTALFLRKFQLVIIGAVQFSRHFTKTALFLTKFQVVMMGAVQIFKSLQQNGFIFEKISAHGNRGSSNFQITSTKLLYCCEHFTS